MFSVSIFVLFFYSIDATHSNGLGQLVNDSPKPKASMKKLLFKNLPYFCMAYGPNPKDIIPREEILYDHSVPDLP